MVIGIFTILLPFMGSTGMGSFYLEVPTIDCTVYKEVERFIV